MLSIVYISKINKMDFIPLRRKSIKKLLNLINKDKEKNRIKLLIKSNLN